jgi:hypothetical protein
MDIVNLSSTSRGFRRTLSPFIFKHVNLSNTLDSSHHCLNVANGPYPENVRELRFSGTALIPDAQNYVGDDADKMDAMKDCLPQAAEDILSNLTQFPNLERLVVRFPYDKGIWWQLSQDTLWLVQETESDSLIFEAGEPWRALAAKAFSAVTSNKPGVVKHFE